MQTLDFVRDPKTGTWWLPAEEPERYLFTARLSDGSRVEVRMCLQRGHTQEDANALVGMYLRERGLID